MINKKQAKIEYANIMRKPQADVGEVHHIVPKSVAKLRKWDDSRTNQKKNLRKLSYQDHFRAHILLCYFLDGEEKTKMLYAWWQMTHSREGVLLSENECARLRAEYSRVVSIAMLGNTWNTGRKLTKKHKEKISKTQIGKIVSQETKDKMSESQKGKTHSQETKDKISKSRSGQIAWNKGKTLNELTKEHKDKISVALSGRTPWNKGKNGKKHSQESKNKMSESQKGKLTCRDLRNGEYKKVTKEEFHSDPLLVGPNSKKPNL
jgi:hypothetical protein